MSLKAVVEQAQDRKNFVFFGENSLLIKAIGQTTLEHIFEDCFNSSFNSISIFEKNAGLAFQLLSPDWYAFLNPALSAKLILPQKNLAETIPDVFAAAHCQDILETSSFAREEHKTQAIHGIQYSTHPIFCENELIATLCLSHGSPKDRTAFQKTVAQRLNIPFQDPEDPPREQASRSTSAWQEVENSLRMIALLLGQFVSQFKMQQKLLLAQEIARIGNWSFDPEVGVPVWSEEIYRIYERDPALGPYPLAEYENIYGPNQFKIFTHAISEAIHNGTPYDIELRLDLPGNTIKWVHALCKPYSKRGPKGHCLEGTIQDITERKILREKLDNMQKLESLSFLAGGIAHDFNNLLGGIFGNIEIAMKHAQNPHRLQKHLQASFATLERARDLTGQLLTFARGGEPRKQVTPITHIVEESCSLALSGSKVEWSLHKKEELPNLFADPNQISQVFNNLLLNARQAMPSGGHVTITVQAEELPRTNELGLPEGLFIKISITDEGSGIPQDIQQKIFDPFFSTKPGGSGIGLTSCHSIVSKHGGSITFHSVEGAGTTFVLHLPATSDVVRKKPLEMETDGPLSGRVLLMDDEEPLREVAKEMLELLGLEVVCAHNGDDALQKLNAQQQTDPFDLVMLDLTVPGRLSGTDVMLAIQESHPSLPGIIVSGYSDSDALANPEKYGFSGRIDKPYSLATLKKEIAQVLSQRPRLPLRESR